MLKPPGPLADLAKAISQATQSPRLTAVFETMKKMNVTISFTVVVFGHAQL